MNVPPLSPHVPSSLPDDGLEILLGLAKTGQIDPWDIDIAQVADEYLKAVARLRDESDNPGSATHRQNLRITGKTLLYLAILLRMKSDKLAGIDYLESMPVTDSLEDFLDSGDMELADGQMVQKLLPYQSLAELIERRTSTKQRRIRKVTLADLIVELKKYEVLEKKQQARRRIERDDARRMADYSQLTSDDIDELAHEEFIEATILKLVHVLERLLVYQESISLTELTEEGGIDKVSAFLALLFLSARGHVAMHQNGFYEELYVSYDDRDPANQTSQIEEVNQPIEKAG